MEVLVDVIRGILFISLALMILGLYKPWVVLWWEDTQYRLKVFRLYGTISLMAALAYLAIQVIR